jgi:two-component system KDP operon response regulator KdpE
VKVLVVDDAYHVRARFVAMLAAVTGVERVLEAGSAADALVALRAHAPKAVVLDLDMPDQGGLAFAPCVKRECPGALLIVVTNDSTDQHRRQCLALGADGFFDKSDEFDAVVRMVARAVAGGSGNGAER